MVEAMSVVVVVELSVWLRCFLEAPGILIQRREGAQRCEQN
jgi:hypothetical protein